MVLQCILHCNKCFLAACGPSIYTINEALDAIIATWPEKAPNKKARKEDPSGEDVDPPPNKRRKITDNEQKPNVIKLLRTDDEEYVVAVTAEDKCIRVFRLCSDGKLEQLSERCMPKRPSAISITPDKTTIVVGDKFGDVYALPLLEVRGNEEKGSTPKAVPENTPAKPFKPSATQLTVHSGRNRKALEAQLQMKEHVKTKEPLKFAHELLLGHVSMLTDLVLAQADDGTGKARDYIITADRDEHIRVSRGVPQAHIIEGYCLGHKQFISKLLLLTEQNLLISAGGDDELYVWDWLNGRLLKKIDIGTAVRKFQDSQEVVPKTRNEDEDSDDISERVAISGLWEGDWGRIVVACEGVPAIIHFSGYRLKDGKDWSHIEIEPLPGNVLDVAVSEQDLVAAIDNIHQPWSTSTIRSSEDRVPPLHFLCFETSLGSRPREIVTAAFQLSDQIFDETDEELDEMEDHNAQMGKGFWELVYNVENLRKRAGMGDEE